MNQSNVDYGKVFGFIISLLLLILYVGILIYLIVTVVNTGTDESIDSGAIYILTTVGGLISALVIAILAITKPGDNPAARFLKNEQNGFVKSVVNIVVGVYLVTWLLAGIAALLWGVLFYPEASKTLGEIGTTWLGLAIAAAYAYFGLKPS